MKYLAIIIIGLTFAASCQSDHIPKEILSKKKMADCLIDLHLSDAIGSQRYSLSLVRDSLAEDLYLSVCQKNSVTTDQFEKSLLFYGRHPEVYTKVYDEVLDRLNALEVKARQEQEAARAEPMQSNDEGNKPQKPNRDSTQTDPRGRLEME